MLEYMTLTLFLKNGHRRDVYISNRPVDMVLLRVKILELTLKMIILSVHLSSGLQENNSFHVLEISQKLIRELKFLNNLFSNAMAK